MENRSIAIDGPAGAGKSTLSKMLAEKFGLIYVDTGAMYRTVGLHILRTGADPHDENAVAERLPEIKIEMCYDDNDSQRMLLNGDDVTEDIRQPQVSIYASDVSALPSVRAFLLEMQRTMAKNYDVIMDGRDIGTVVLPGAGLKIFLSAAPEERARRRHRELLGKAVDTTYEEVLRDMKYRDENDANRAASPLKPAEDAVMVDTTGNSLEKSFEVMAQLISEKLYGDVKSDN
jgi:CMP/dCMP kinase